VIGFTAVPDAIIVPFARQIGAPTWVVGPLLAADCVGVVVGARLVEARSPARQRALIGPLAMASDLENPYHSFEFRGDAELIGDPGKTLSVDLWRKYLGEDPPPEPEDVMRVIVRLVPEKIVEFSV
jgi:hypothetical protein